jgi:transcriptional regulator with PAS, ATPase and Fis domain
VASGNANVLITGESGVGKELVARSIHNHSLRRNRPLIPINCSALPDTLFESELFGYEKGAFTGAFQSKPGLVELANGGTLFLDEVCEMSQPLQAKLLRMLEDRKIRRIGGEKEIRVDLRIVTATNRVVDDMLASGALREDFFYRINTFNIHVPPLRQRLDDIPLLAKYFLQQLEEKYSRGIDTFDSEAMAAMRRYPWPGNVRELQNVIERTYYLANPVAIRGTDFPTYVTARPTTDHREEWESLSYKEAKDMAIEEFEQEYLVFHLERNDWNISKTAEKCGIDRRTIHRLINRFELDKA